jgi:XTP/dITP diphosphohydrolase
MDNPITIIFATNNQHKVKEVNEILQHNNVNINLKTMAEVGIDADIVEDGTTLEENAKIKSDFIFNNYTKNALGEDTGLEVMALNNEPGIHTARYAGDQRSNEDNMAKLLNQLKDKKDRSAQFRTIISLHLEGKDYLFEGIAKGSIAKEKSGNHGFGYDPIFIPEGYDQSFAALDATVKNKISHRAKAVHKLLTFLSDYNTTS